MSSRLIAHVDMDAFYASVEQLDQPTFLGRPVIVGGPTRRGVVCAASYEARAFGVRSAMPVYAARKLCPDGIYLPVRMARYKQISAKVFGCFSEFTPVVEGLSLDEAFLDLSATPSCENPPALGATIKRRIHAYTGLTASVGLGPNKLVAKIASERSKPDGLLYIPAELVQETLDPLPVTVLWGIGPRTGSQLENASIRTVRELRLAPEPLARALFGNQARRFQALAQGHDERAVTGQVRERSVSHETTFEQDLTDPVTLSGILRTLTEDLCASLRAIGLRPQTVTLKVRTSDYQRHTRQRQFRPPDNSFGILWPLAQCLLRDWLRSHPSQALRLIGVGARNFSSSDQLALLEDGLNRERQLDAATDAVRERFGKYALTRGMPSVTD